MSQNFAVNGSAARALPLVPETPARETPSAAPRSLRAVQLGERARTKPTLVYAFVALGAVAAVVVTQLMLGVGLSQGAYELNALQNQHRQLGWERQAVATDLAAISSPQYIAANAEAVGMTLGGTPAYITLSTAGIVGVPQGAGETGLGGANGQGIGNSMIAGTPLATSPDAAVPAAGADTAGAASGAAAPGPVPLERGLPSPQTR